jgi:glycosyltransferase involved in cell wall biosynthesis
MNYFGVEGILSAVSIVSDELTDTFGEFTRGLVRPELALPYTPKVSVIVPTKNEAKNLPFVLPRIPAWVGEIVLVDGYSTDDTVAVARSLIPSIRVVNQDRPGKGAALRCGIQAARGDIIVTLDADGSADPAEIPTFV